MAFLDEERGVIVARVVYDGAPEAGKTTNIRRITESISNTRRGELTSPGSSGPRTEYFDWVDFRGGYIQGYHLHCQILAVPGQFSLRHRRGYLLNSADVVVFVVDSGAENLADNTRAFEFLRERIAKGAPELPPVPFLIQANKQDLPGAMSPLELAKRLGTDERVPILGASATAREGIMQTFLIAIRLASERVQELLRLKAIPGVAHAELSSESLYATLDQLEVLPDDMERGTTRRVQIEVQASESEDVIDLGPCLEAIPNELQVPAASQIIAGHLWPPLKGRSILAAINGADDIAVNPRAVAWAQPGSIELHSANGWVLHTSEASRFADEPAGRYHLLRVVRRCTSLSDWMPEGRAYVLANEEDTWRFWTLTKDTPSLHEMFERALRTRDVNELRTTCQAIEQALHTVADASPDAWYDGLTRLDWLAISGNRLVCLAVPSLDAPPAGAEVVTQGAEPLMAQIRELVRRGLERDPALRERLDRALDGMPLSMSILRELDDERPAALGTTAVALVPRASIYGRDALRETETAGR